MILPGLPLAEWRETRDALHGYARVLGGIRRALTPPQKHWWHITLHASARGLTTTPIPSGAVTFELVLNPLRSVVEISTSHGTETSVSLEGQSAVALHASLARALSDLGLACPDLDGLRDAELGYDPAMAGTFWRSLAQIDVIYKEFKGTLREETGPVQVFPHHLDLSLNWFSGRRVPDVDPADAENADEQMNFGFVTGDSSVPQAYFYATAYPTPAGLTDSPLAEGAYWHTEGFTGAILEYEQLVDAADPRATLLGFLRSAHEAGSRLMQSE